MPHGVMEGHEGMTLAPLAPRVLSTWVADWAQQGSCANQDPDALFVRGKAQRSPAKLVCRSARSWPSAWPTRSTAAPTSVSGAG